mmetsp:Transcript_28644/g.32893  ORF Transcript_28644/g.32893 Transcript_28644/m.32893 type:complete len:158 (+) Transcript_28644:257-730(+)
MADLNLNSKYGSITERNDGEVESGTKEETNEPFLSEDDGDYRYITSTSEDQRRKCLNAFFPVMIFVLLMGSIVFALLRNFDTLYPGHGDSAKSSRRPSNTNEHKSYVVPTTDADNGNHQASKDFLYSDCTYHSKCDAIGLIGQCCPTPEGINLDCCN